MFPPNWNEKASSVTCLSSMSVVLNARLADQLTRRQKKTKRNEETSDSDAFFEVEHKHQTPVTFLTMHAIASLLYMFQWFMQANRKYIYVSKKASINMLSGSKPPKCSKFSVINIQENQWTFPMAPHGRRLWLPK